MPRLRFPLIRDYRYAPPGRAAPPFCMAVMGRSMDCDDPRAPPCQHDWPGLIADTTTPMRAVFRLGNKYAKRRHTKSFHYQFWSFNDRWVAMPRSGAEAVDRLSRGRVQMIPIDLFLPDGAPADFDMVFVNTPVVQTMRFDIYDPPYPDAYPPDANYKFGGLAMPLNPVCDFERVADHVIWLEYPIRQQLMVSYALAEALYAVWPRWHQAQVLRPFGFYYPDGVVFHPLWYPNGPGTSDVYRPLSVPRIEA